eukprot:85134-Alexandrium_andersonii.AAC.1
MAAYVPDSPGPGVAALAERRAAAKRVQFKFARENARRLRLAEGPDGGVGHAGDSASACGRVAYPIRDA